jgi:tRNA threonylcarbamoyladenosine biosynthesis protein TsaE
MNILNQNKMDRILQTSNLSQTQKLAEELAKTLKPGDFLAFYGNLGSGKTTFIQGLAKGLGIERRIISPTFIIVRSYEISDQQLATSNQTARMFYHIDLYRTETKNDLLSVGLDQIIEDKNSIIALEWAEKMGEMLPKKRIEVNLENLGEDERKITIKRI